MNDRRIEPEDLGGLEGLPPDDPRTRALEGQPRARAQLRAYRDFVAPGDAPDGARVPEAEAQLKEALERELGVTIAGDAEDAGGRAAQRRPKAGASTALPRRGGFWSVFEPRLRPAFALAALVIVAGGAWLFTATRREGGPIMRGSAPPVVQGGLVVRAAPERLADGSLRLSWTPAAEAESYAVVFLSPGLVEIVRVDGLRDTFFDLEPRALPAGLERGSRVLWRVVAMRGVDEVGRSPVAALTVP